MIRLLCLIALCGLGVWAQPADPRNYEATAEFLGPPRDAAEWFVGPPKTISPLLALAPPPEFPIPNIPLLDQEFETILRGRSDLDYLIPSPEAILKSILGFVFLLALAYIGGHPRVTELERTFGIAHLTTTGLPFVLLGLIASQRSVGVLTPQVLMEVAPLLTLGLGWIGFSIGYRFDGRLVEDLPKGFGRVVWMTTIVPFVAVAGASGTLMLWLSEGPMDRTLLRDAIMLGIAGAMTAKSSPYLWRDKGLQQEDLERMGRIVQLERILGIVGLMLVAAYFRGDDTVVLWQLPALAWLFLSLGVGLALGGVVHTILATSRSDAESVVLLLGSISFAAGMAHYLRLSAIAVCFLVGAVLANAPSRWKDTVEGVASKLERPIYFLFLLIAGALWLPSDWRGWALMALFVPARLFGKKAAVSLVQRASQYATVAKEKQWLTYAPTGAISLAVVISAQNLYGGPRISWIVTAVIAGSLLNEVLVQRAVRRTRSVVL